ncbi:MAG: hypothetical protein C0424_05290 [Sphingobacteriaceae bacterium]|nr:hypothetical protein [Sphingobacteriaceae bacterium]
MQAIARFYVALNMKKALLSGLLALFIVQHAMGQMSQLSVYKANGQLAMRIYPGETLHLRTPAGWQSDELVMLLTDSIVVGDKKWALTDIQKVRTIRNGMAASGANLLVAGVIWPGIVAINGLSANIRPLVTNRSLISSAFMLGGGSLLTALSRRSYRTTEPGRLRIVHFNFEKTTPIAIP